MKTLGIAILALIAFLSGGCSVFGFYMYLGFGFDPSATLLILSGFAICAACIVWIVRIKRSERSERSERLKMPPDNERPE